MQGPATTARIRSGATRARVHEAALHLFTERGYAGTSLQQIADRLGVTKAAVYYYYRTKPQLLGALLHPLHAECARLLAEVGSSPRRQRLSSHALLSCYVEVLIRHRRLLLLLDRDPSIRSQPGLPSDLLSLRRTVEHLILGADPTQETQLGLQVTLAGLSEALLTFPSWDEERLQAFLLGTGRRLLKPSRTRSTLPSSPQLSSAQAAPQPAATSGLGRP